MYTQDKGQSIEIYMSLAYVFSWLNAPGAFISNIGLLEPAFILQFIRPEFIKQRVLRI